MEMKLGATIAQLRQKKGLTQEQLAGKLGISAPAVSKWETDTSYPDITLLCPLARALDANVDTLLQFEEQLSDQQVIDLVNDVLETARRDGYLAGEQMILSLLHKYPNSIALKFNAAAVWDSFHLCFPTAPDDVRDQWTAHKKELLRDVRSSGAAAYWQIATLQLAGMSISDGELEQGEALLNELPEHIADPTLTWSLLYLKQNRPDQALKTTQKRLYSLIHQVQACLASMINPNIIADNERLLQLCEIYRSMDQLFGLGGLYDGLFLSVYLRMHRYQEAADALVCYAQAMTVIVTLPNQWLFTPGVDFKENQPSSSREIRLLLLRALEDEEYTPLHDYPQYQTAVEILQSSL